MKTLFLAFLVTFVGYINAAYRCSQNGYTNNLCKANGGTGPLTYVCTSLCTSGSNSYCDETDASCGSSTSCSGTMTASTFGTTFDNYKSYDTSTTEDLNTVVSANSYLDFYTNTQ